MIQPAMHLDRFSLEELCALCNLAASKVAEATQASTATPLSATPPPAHGGPSGGMHAAEGKRSRAVDRVDQMPEAQLLGYMAVQLERKLEQQLELLDSPGAAAAAEPAAGNETAGWNQPSYTTDELTAEKTTAVQHCSDSGQPEPRGRMPQHGAAGGEGRGTSHGSPGSSESLSNQQLHLLLGALSSYLEVVARSRKAPGRQVALRALHLLLQLAAGRLGQLGPAELASVVTATARCNRMWPRDMGQAAKRMGGLGSTRGELAGDVRELRPGPALPTLENLAEAALQVKGRAGHQKPHAGASSGHTVVNGPGMAALCAAFVHAGMPDVARMLLQP